MKKFNTCSGLKMFLIGFLSIALVAFFNVSSYGQILTSDQSDYAPGSTVTLTGSGFGANETVTMQVTHNPTCCDDASSSSHLPWNVNADAYGSFTATWDVPSDQDELGSSLIATAIGQSSNYYAEALFTDGGFTVTVLTSSGAPITTASVKYSNNNWGTYSATSTNVSGVYSIPSGYNWVQVLYNLGSTSQVNTGGANITFYTTAVTAKVATCGGVGVSGGYIKLNPGSSPGGTWITGTLNGSGITTQELFAGSWYLSANYAGMAENHQTVIVGGNNSTSGQTFTATFNTTRAVVTGATTVYCDASSTGNYNYFNRISFSPSTGADLLSGTYYFMINGTSSNYLSSGVPVISKVISGCNQSFSTALCSSPSITTSNGCGNVTLTAPSGRGYLWSNGATIQSTTVTIANAYTVTVTYDFNCNGTANPSIVYNTTVSIPSLPNIGAGSNVIICPGAPTLLTGTGGVSYTWSPNISLSATSGSSVTASPTSTITYTVNGTSSAGCNNTATITVTTKTGVSISSATATTSPICSNATTTLTAHDVAGDGAIVNWYSQSGGNGTHYGSGITLNNAASGTYFAYVTGDCGSTAEATVTVAAYSNPTPIIIAGTNPFCLNGSTTLDAGAGFNSYLWNDASTNQTMVVSSAGTYYVTVTEAHGCQGTTSLVANTMVCNSISCSVTSTSFCAGASSSINYSAIGTYNNNNVFIAQLSDAVGSFANPVDIGTVVSMVSGNISITIPVNAVGTGYRMRVISISPAIIGSDNGNDLLISSNPSPSITENDNCGIALNDGIICKGSSANLDAGSYSFYLWTCSVTTQSVTVSPTSTTTYSVTVTNAYGCIGIADFTITVNSNPLAASACEKILCNGGTTTVNVTACEGTPNYSGTGTFTVGQGEYTYTVTDANGCKATSYLCITQPTVVSHTTVKTNVSGCGTALGSIAITACGGTGIKCYSKDNGSCFQGACLFSNLSAGSYTIKVRDANTCLSLPACIIISTNSAISFTTTVTNATTCTAANGRILVLATGGSGYFNYSKDSGRTYQSSNIFNCLLHGTYKIRVKDILGCLTNIVNIPVGPSCREAEIVSSNTNEAGSFTIYPNPASSQTTIIFSSDKEETYSLRLVDITGRIILAITNTSVVGDNQYQMNLSGAAKGIYMVLLQKGDAVLQSKIVVQ